ncbi:MAG: hypothetical protein E7812_11605 [Phenylobacterium sp.]|nr:MAG: hypothetical protein E7812_11605 [Phenylobacterium sp.]
MIAAVLLAGSILGSHPLSMDDPQRRTLLVRSEGVVLVRFDADGFVQARGCDGRLRPVGSISERPVAIRITHDGALTGLVYDPDLEPTQRYAFERMMLAVGLSDWRALASTCLPASSLTATAASASQSGVPAAAIVPSPLAQTGN